jgi:hypothetical protein
MMKSFLEHAQIGDRMIKNPVSWLFWTTCELWERATIRCSSLAVRVVVRLWKGCFRHGYIGAVGLERLQRSAGRK